VCNSAPADLKALHANLNVCLDTIVKNQVKKQRQITRVDVVVSIQSLPNGVDNLPPIHIYLKMTEAWAQHGITPSGQYCMQLQSGDDTAGDSFALTGISESFIHPYDSDSRSRWFGSGSGRTTLQFVYAGCATNG